MTSLPVDTGRCDAATSLPPLPLHWEAKRLRRIASLVTKKAEERSFSVVLENIESGTGRIVHSAGEFGGIGVAFQAGDILYGKLRPYLAKTWAADRSGEAVGDFHVIRPNVNPAFLTYFLLTKPAVDQLNGATHGAKMPRVGWETIGDLMVPVPPNCEQDLIVAYITKETMKIDASFKRQSYMIALLLEKQKAFVTAAVTRGAEPVAAMRSSGVEWLGAIPSHWSVTRIANLFREVNQPSDDERPILSVSIHDGVSDNELSEAESGRKVARSEDRSKYKAVEPGDLVYNMMRAWQGGFGAVTVPGAVSPAYVVARPESPHLAEYIELVLRTPNAIAEMKRHSRGITDFRMRLYWDEFKDIQVPLPPEDEILEILQRVWEINAETARVVDAASRMNKLLQERRSALISAAVTGKIDVRSYHQNTNRDAA